MKVEWIANGDGTHTGFVDDASVDLCAEVTPSGDGFVWVVDGPADTLRGTCMPRALSVAMLLAADGLRHEAKWAAKSAPADVAFDAQADAPLPDSYRIIIEPVRVVHQAIEGDDLDAVLAAESEALGLFRVGRTVAAAMVLILAGWWEVEDHTLVKRIKRDNGQLVRYMMRHDARTLHHFIDGEAFTVSIPLVVWTWCNGPLPSGFQLHHKNGNRSDCSLGNVEPTTLSERRWAATDAWGLGLNVPRYGFDWIHAEWAKRRDVGLVIPRDLDEVLDGWGARRDAVSPRRSQRLSVAETMAVDQMEMFG